MTATDPLKDLSVGDIVADTAGSLYKIVDLSQVDMMSGTPLIEARPLHAKRYFARSQVSRTERTPRGGHKMLETLPNPYASSGS